MTELPNETAESSAPKSTPAPSRAPAIIVAVTILAIVAISLWYLVQPQPLLVQGEADGTRIDIAARVDGRVLELPVDRGQNVTAGQVLVTIDNPELLTRLKEAEAAKAVALADLKRIEVGTRAEVVAARRAALAAAEANARAGRADLRPHQAAHRRAILPRCRSSTRRRRRSTSRAAASSRPSSPRRGDRRLHGRGARRGPGRRRQGRRGDRDAARRRSPS